MSDNNNDTSKTNQTPLTDYSKLDTVNISFRRPAKWYMYVTKQVLKSKDSIQIRSVPSASAQAIRVADSLKRLGYVTITKYYSESIVHEGRMLRHFVIHVKKTNNFDKLFNEREEERKKFLETQEKN